MESLTELIIYHGQVYDWNSSPPEEWGVLYLGSSMDDGVYLFVPI